MIRWRAPDVFPIQTTVHQSRATHLHTRQSRMACSLVGRVPAAPPDSCSFQKPPDGWEDNKGTVITALSDFFPDIESDNQFNCCKEKYCQTIAMSGCRRAGRTLWPHGKDSRFSAAPSRRPADTSPYRCQLSRRYFGGGWSLEKLGNDRCPR
jgi:hypothetical protein